MKEDLDEALEKGTEIGKEIIRESYEMKKSLFLKLLV